MYQILYFLFLLLESGQDYGRRSATLRFGACQERSCRTVTIYNDVKVELLIETFSVSLSTSSEDDRIRVNTHPSTVEIMDDDSMH